MTFGIITLLCPFVVQFISFLCSFHDKIDNNLTKNCWISCTFQLSSNISDWEIARLASLISPFTMVTVVLRYFGLLQAQISHSRRDHTLNSEGFNRELLHKFRNKGGSRKVFLFCNKSKVLLGLLCYRKVTRPSFYDFFF